MSNTGTFARGLRRLAWCLGMHRWSYRLACWIFCDSESPLTRTDIQRLEEMENRYRW
jgi:hypothetical protein